MEKLRGWLRRYILRFKTGIFGLSLVVVVFILDSYSRLETGWKLIHKLSEPAIQVVLQSGLLHLALLLVGIGFMVYSTTKGKATPLPRTTEERIQALESGVTNLGAIGGNLSALTVKSNVMWRAGIDTSQAVPERAWVLMRILDLTVECSEIVDQFNLLRSFYGISPTPATQPFSKWRLTNVAVGVEDHARPIVEWEFWARRLTSHVDHCNQFSANYGIHLDGGLLFSYVDRWEYDTLEVSGEHLRTLLQAHGGKLKELKEQWTGRWKTEVEERFTT